MQRPGGSTFGGALPVMPASAAIGTSESKRFVGVDDASQASVAAKVAGSSRSSLLLIETGGQETTVRVTLRFTLNGTRAVSQAAASLTFTIPASHDLVINDVGTALIGLQRTTFGDLRNMQLDVDVLNGGRVLPFLQSVDNATGDVTVRAAD